MRIDGLEPDIDLYRGYCDDLARLMESQKRTDRPCSECHLPCVAHKSETCTCACAPNCEHAPKQMSSDGERFPIEAKIAPLVYAFSKLRECPPCWSCEGHDGGGIRPNRLPRVIFYARSSLYPALISEAVASLLFQKKLSGPWEVTVTPVGNMLDPTYTLQPNMADIQDVQLDRLQADIMVIAENLEAGVATAARTYHAELSAALRGGASNS